MTLLDVTRRRWDGTHEVDEWGLDTDLLDLVAPFADLRWSIDLDGAGLLPADGPAVIVANRRFGLSEPPVLARAVGAATGRPLRFLGPGGQHAALRRLGGAGDRPEELAGLARARHLVSVHLGCSPRNGRCAGPLEPEALALVPAGVPVLPAAVVGRELGRAWRVTLGPPVPAPSDGRPWTDAVRAAVQVLLDGAC